MKLLTFLFVYPIVWIISILPFRVLYFFSDFIFLLIYSIFGYRKKVVLSNLQLAFPEKSIKELLSIRKKFYRHFVDIFIEIIKTFTASEKEIHKRYQFTNIDFLNDLYKDGKSIVLIGSHYANWEWMLSLNSFVNYKGVAAYTKIRNNYFKTKIIKSRMKFGTEMVQTSKILPKTLYNHQNNIQAAYGLLSDQSPSLAKTYYWSKFLNVVVPIHTGAEMLAKKYNMNMVFVNTEKIKRGYYKTSFSLIQEDSNKNSEYGLTDCFLEKAEEQIRNKPEYYLWTHKRFKHKDKAPK